jgi:hypothetical protein
VGVDGAGGVRSRRRGDECRRGRADERRAARGRGKNQVVSISSPGPSVLEGLAKRRRVVGADDSARPRRSSLLELTRARRRAGQTDVSPAGRPQTEDHRRVLAHDLLSDASRPIVTRSSEGRGAGEN